MDGGNGMNEDIVWLYKVIDAEKNDYRATTNGARQVE